MLWAARVSPSLGSCSGLAYEHLTDHTQPPPWRTDLDKRQHRHQRGPRGDCRVSSPAGMQAQPREPCRHQTQSCWGGYTRDVQLLGVGKLPVPAER